MGKVYAATDPLIERMVAVKTIRADLLEPHEREEFLERFRSEVRAAGRCVHPAIVAIHDFADDGQQPYIVMEYVKGRSLAAALRDTADRIKQIPRLATAMLEVLDGLAAAHAQGVVHRDIKPANIMLTPAGRAKITDFGIARLGLSNLTAVGGVIGTPAYMAPEQALGRPVDQRVDLFATAAMLYEIFLGQAPFAAPTMAETLLRLTAPEPADLRGLAGTTLGEVLRRGLAKNPAERFDAAETFRAALRAALAGDALPPAAPDATVVMPPPPPRRNPSPLDPALVERLRLDLVRRIGPLASTLLRRATDAADSEQELLRACVAMLDTPEERVAFMRAHGSVPAADATRIAPPSGEPRFALSDAARAGAITAVAFVFGPIARLLVQKAAEQAEDAADFVAILCAQAPAGEASALRPRLAALF